MWTILTEVDNTDSQRLSHVDNTDIGGQYRQRWTILTEVDNTDIGGQY